ncbi:MAG: ABC transporter substrate-binding protein [Nocardioides sp.]|uniref:ABC transporter substrate-binding protein n=1 Tax=Nocardioides sp. TaxID=35761 RepID=UPI0039E688D5
MPAEHQHLTRRGALAALALSLGSVGALAACGSESSGGSSTGSSTGSGSAGADGSWTFTDGLGQKITLDHTPERIVAYGDEAAALINFGIKPVAIFGFTNPADDPMFDGIDLDGIEIIGTEYGEINVEKLAALQPDLILTTTYDGDKPSLMYGFKDKTQMKTIRAIAPVAGILQSGLATDVIESNEELASSLGIDVDGGQVAKDRATFTKAGDRLKKIAKRGLKIITVYGEDANLYYVIPSDDPAVAYYASLGLDFIDTGTKKDYYWHIVSWENADEYDADVVLYTTRDSYTPEQFEKQPTFARVAAVKAGQFFGWDSVGMDYVSQARYMNKLADYLDTAKKVV